MIDLEHEGQTENKSEDEILTADEQMRRAVKALAQSRIETEGGTSLLIEVLGLTEEKSVEEWTVEDYGKVLEALPSSESAESAADAQSIRELVVDHAIEHGQVKDESGKEILDKAERVRRIGEDLAQENPHFINQKAEEAARQAPFAHLQYHIERNLVKLAGGGDEGREAFAAKAVEWREQYKKLLAKGDLTSEELHAVSYFLSLIEKAAHEKAQSVEEPKKVLLTEALKKEFDVAEPPATAKEETPASTTPLMEVKSYVSSLAERLGEEPDAETLKREFTNLRAYSDTFEGDDAVTPEQRDELSAHIEKASAYLTDALSAAVPQYELMEFISSAGMGATPEGAPLPEGILAMTSPDPDGDTATLEGLDPDDFGAEGTYLRRFAENFNAVKEHPELLAALREQLSEALRDAFDAGTIGIADRDSFEKLFERMDAELARHRREEVQTPPLGEARLRSIDEDFLGDKPEKIPMEELGILFRQVNEDAIAHGRTSEHDAILNKIGPILKKEQDRIMKLQERGRERDVVSDLDEKLYGGAIDASIQTRFEEIETTTGRGRTVEKEDEARLRLYYADILRWVGTVASNARQEGGQFDMNPERYRQYKRIMAEGEDLLLRGGAGMPNILANIEYLKTDGPDGGRLTKYFSRKVKVGGEETPIPVQRTGILQQRTETIGEHGENTIEFTMPDTLVETMQLIEAMNPNWQGKFIDAKGEFHVDNFTQYVREQLKTQEGEHPRDRISMDTINIKTMYSDIPLSQILNLQKFLKERKLEIHGSDDDIDNIRAGWGQLKDHPTFKVGRARMLYYEAEFFCMFHTFMNKAKDLPASKKDWLEYQMELHGGNPLVPNMFGVLLGLPGTENGKEEFTEFWNGNADGVVGRMFRETFRAYSRYGEFCARWKHTDDRPKTFLENDFYKYMEPDGASTYLLSLAEGSLNNNQEANAVYNEFVSNLVNETLDEYESAAGTDEAKKKQITRLRDKYTAKLGEEKISFSNSILLTELEGEIAVDVDGARTFTREEKKAVATGAKKRAQDRVRANLKTGFIDEVKKVQVWKGAKVDNGRINLEDMEASLPQLDSGTGKFKRLPPKKGQKEGDLDLEKVKIGKLLDMFDPEKHIDFFDKDMPDVASLESFAGQPKFAKNFEEIEQIGIGISMAMHGMKSRDEMNYFRGKRFNMNFADVIDVSIKKGLQKAFELNDTDSDYAFRMGYNYAWMTETMAELDSVRNGGMATGFYYATRGMDMKEYRIRQWEARKSGGNFLDIGVINHLLLPFDQMVMIRREGEAKAKLTLADIVDGGQGDQYTTRAQRKVGSSKDYVLSNREESQVVENTYRKGADLMDVLIEGQFDFDKIVSIHPYYGTLQIDHAAAVQFVDKFWGATRYGIGKHSDKDYSQLIWDGEKNITLLEYMVGKKAIKLGIAYHMEQGKTAAEALEKLYEDPSHGVFCAVVGAGLAARIKMDGGNHPLTSNQIEELQMLLAEFFSKMSRDDESENFHKKHESFLTARLFSIMMKEYGDKKDINAMRRKELGISAGVGLLAGIIAALGLFVKDSMKIS